MGFNDTDYPVDMPTNKPNIKVIGVGGGGCNIVAEIHNKGLKDVDLMVCNTDVQALETSPVAEKIILGSNLADSVKGIRKGLGAGCDPTRGKAAAEASLHELKKSISGETDMVFITACLGGGTGTGAAPVIAKLANEMGKLTVGVVTIPFKDEGFEFSQRAMKGLQELQKYTDSLLIIDNQKIYEVYGDLRVKEAFKKVNEVLVTSVQGISEFMTSGGDINSDFADVTMVMKHSGMAIISTGIAKGPDRATEAVQKAFSSPFLSNYDLKTSKAVLLSISCSEDVRMSEVSQVVEHARSFTGNPQKFKRGIDYNWTDDEIKVTVLATGFDVTGLPQIKEDSGKIVINNDGVSSGMGGENSGTDNTTLFNSAVYQPKEAPIVTSPREVTGDATYVRSFGQNEKPALVVDDDSDILSLENEPAYIRKAKKKGLRATNSSSFSPDSYTLRDNSGENVISTDNSFLHQTQD
ncbi:MAG: cell division protein FtsZ [Candidatus Egerieousia sp.]